jgi:hypothetical protein
MKAGEAAEAVKRSVKFRAWRPPVVPEPTDRSLLLYTMKERHWSAAEIAQMWGVSADTVRDLFHQELGVLKIDRPQTRTKRAYSTLRNPESVLDRVYNRLSSGS